MERHTRYQGVIIRGDHILLISHREHNGGQVYWVIPGGGIEPGEGEEDCVMREMKEETGLDVRIERLLMDEEGLPGGVYRRLKSYLCNSVGGEPQPGFDPEPEAAAVYRIEAVGWFDLRQPLSWGPELLSDPWTYPQLLRIRERLGY